MPNLPPRAAFSVTPGARREPWEELRSRSNSNFLAVGSDVFGPGLWVVGDSVFPGQGTMATVISAIRVVERITGQSWPSIKTKYPRRPELDQALDPTIGSASLQPQP